MNKKYICGFVRFHPLLDNASYCKDKMHVIFDRNTVFIDTSVSAEEIWMKQIMSKNRNMVRKAEKHGLVFRAEYDFESLEAFIKLYNSTMERLHADPFYYFSKSYYDGLRKECLNHAFLGTVKLEDHLVCGAIFFYDGPYGHYHLEGSDYEFSSLGANNFLLWNAAKELQQLGVKKFHLGGGYNSSPTNSLFKFKRSFSRNLADFQIGRWIFNEAIYRNICAEWEKKNPQKVQTYGVRLLKYRY